MTMNRQISLDIVIEQSQQLTRNHFPDTIAICHPGLFRINGAFGATRAISITGQHCQLNCSHCGGRLLRGMADGSSPQSFLAKCLTWADNNVPGILISGGADLDGQLPWHSFLPAIRQLNKETNLHLSVHTGLATPEIISDLKSAGIHLFMFDLVPDNSVFHDVFKQTEGCQRMLQMIDALKSCQASVAPHIILGLSPDIQSNVKSLTMLQGLNIESIVVVQFMPLPGTPLAKQPTISRDETIRFIAHLRREFPTTEISLGCARDRRDFKLEQQAIETGINRIAIPSDETIQYIDQKKTTAIKYSQCCSIHKNLKSPQELPDDETKS